MRLYVIGLAVALWSSPGRAEPATTSVDARAHFESGLEAVSRGELERALQEFQAAYAIQPRYAVLFNIGQAQAALGRPVAATKTFEAFLEQGGDHIPPGRRAEVAGLIEQNRKLIGTLTLKGATPGSLRVWLDGRALSSEEMGKPVLTTIGEHTLLHSSGQGFPVELRVVVEPQTTTEVVLPAPATAVRQLGDPETPAIGHLEIVCKTPGIAVEVAGAPAGQTPLIAPLPTASGRVNVRFSRAGYEPVTLQVSIARDQTSTLTCSLPLIPSAAAIERQRTSTRRRIVGSSLAGVGLASLTAGAIVYAWNQGRYMDWRDARTPEQPLVQRAVQIQRADDAAVGLLVLGAGLSVLGGWTLLTR